MRIQSSVSPISASNLALLSVVLILCAGCSGTSTFHQGSTTATASAGLSGKVFGGQQPVTGSMIQLYAAGSSEYGSGAQALLTTTVMTDQYGHFSIPSGSYTCPASNPETYMVATGGDPGVGTLNPAIAQMAALGPCDNLTSATVITINEVTTVASVWPLAPFMNYGAEVGTIPASLPQMATAFANVNSLANIATGLAPGTSVPQGVTIPVAEINALADILATCTNSNGTTTCSQLFALATLPNGPVPTNTLDAALNIALNPAANVAALFALPLPNAPFQPSLFLPPADWTLGSAITSSLGLPVPGYYVDSVNGNDANSGLSPSQPVKTIAQLTTLDAANPYNSWNLAANAHWREQLISPRAGMTVQAFGAGAKPILDASDIIPNKNWKKTAGYENIYQVTVPIDYYTEWMNLWRNGSYVTSIPYSLSTLDASTSPAWTTVDTTVGSEQNTLSAVNTLMETIYLNVQTNPKKDGATYEYAHRGNGLLMAYGGTVSGIATEKNLSRNGSMELGDNGQNVYAYNVDAAQGSKHNLIIFYNLPGQQIEIHNCTAEHSYSGPNNSTGKILVVYTGQTFPDTGQSLLVDSCNLTTDLDGATGMDGLYGHMSGTGNIDSMTFQNNTGSSGTFYGSHATSTLWDGNYGPIELGNYDEGSMQEVTNSNISSPATIISDFGTGSNWNIHDNPLLEGGPGALGLWIWGTVSITNSTVSTPGSVMLYAGAPVALTLRGNTFSTVEPNAYIYAPSVGTTINSDYNVWCNPATGGSAQFSLPSGNYFYAGYKAATGQDAHSVLCGIQSISPASGNPNSVVPITITGAGTHFSTSSVVTVSGTGITVGPVSSATATSLTVPLTIAPGAAATTYSITVTTGSEVYTLSPAFTVL